MNCKNCNTELFQNFCPQCGQPAILKRINGSYIMHEIEHVLHFERGILYTIRELILRPGENIRQYIFENRSRLVKPILFIIVTSIIYTLISHYFHIEDEYMKYEGFEKSAIGKILGWMQANYGYMNIIIGIFIALWLKVFFKEYGYNFFELLILLCFILGNTMLIFALFALLEGLFHFKLFVMAGIIGTVFTIWAIANFFGNDKIKNYLKSFLSYILGIITFYIFIFTIGISIDYLSQ